MQGRVREGLVALGGVVGGAILVGSNVLDFSLEEVALLEEAWSPESWRRRTRTLVRKGKALLNLARGRGRGGKGKAVPPRQVKGSLELGSGGDHQPFQAAPWDLTTAFTSQRRQQKRERRRAQAPPTPTVNLADVSGTAAPRAGTGTGTGTATPSTVDDLVTIGLDSRQCLEIISSPTLLESQLFWRSVGGMVALVMFLLGWFLYKRFFRTPHKKVTVPMSKRSPSPRRKSLSSNGFFKAKLLPKSNGVHMVIEDGPPVIDEDEDEAYQQQQKASTPKRAPSPFVHPDEEVKEERRDGSKGAPTTNGHPEKEEHDGTQATASDSSSSGGEVPQHEVVVASSQGDEDTVMLGPKRVRFSAWQTEDCGDGEIQRTPFEAYELEAYDDSSSDGSGSSYEDTSSGSDDGEDGGSDFGYSGSDDEAGNSTPHSTQSQ